MVLLSQFTHYTAACSLIGILSYWDKKWEVTTTISLLSDSDFPIAIFRKTEWSAHFAGSWCGTKTKNHSLFMLWELSTPLLRVDYAFIYNTFPIKRWSDVYKNYGNTATGKNILEKNLC